MISKKIFGIKLKQRNIGTALDLFCFTTTVKDILTWAGIKRTEEFRAGAQRVLKPARQKAISRFLRSDEHNLIPNSVLLSFKEGTVKFEDKSSSVPEEYNNSCGDKVQLGFIEFDYESNSKPENKPALIVDGQHRLFGIDVFDENIPVFVTALLNANVVDQAFNFIVINNKAQKVNVTNVKSIISDLVGEDETKFNQRLQTAGINYGRNSVDLIDADNREDSPFKGLLNWESNRTGNKVIELTTIENCMKYIQKSFHFLLSDENTTQDILFQIWNAIKKVYEDIWDDIKDENKLFSKVGMEALNVFIIDELHSAWNSEFIDIYNNDKIKEYVTKRMGKVCKDFWMVEWNQRLLSNKTFREYIQSDIRKISENIRLEKPWRNDLTLVDEE